jgi:hypothetical protein
MHMYIYYNNVSYAYGPIHELIYDYLLPLYCNACLYTSPTIYLYMLHSSKTITHNTCLHISTIYTPYICLHVSYAYIRTLQVPASFYTQEFIYDYILLRPNIYTRAHTFTHIKIFYMFTYIYADIHLWKQKFLRPFTYKCFHTYTTIW